MYRVYRVYSNLYLYEKKIPSFFFFFRRKKKYLVKNYITKYFRPYTPTFPTFYTQNKRDPTHPTLWVILYKFISVPLGYHLGYEIVCKT